MKITYENSHLKPFLNPYNTKKSIFSRRIRFSVSAFIIPFQEFRKRPIDPLIVPIFGRSDCLIDPISVHLTR